MAEASVIFQKISQLGSPGTPVWAAVAPDSTKPPYIVYTEVAKTPQNTLKGPVDLTNHLVQIECWSRSYKGAHDIAEAIVGAMLSEHLFSGSPPGQFSARQVDSRDYIEEDMKYHAVILEFSVWTR